MWNDYGRELEEAAVAGVMLCKNSALNGETEDRRTAIDPETTDSDRG